MAAKYRGKADLGECSRDAGEALQAGLPGLDGEDRVELALGFGG